MVILKVAVNGLHGVCYAFKYHKDIIKHEDRVRFVQVSIDNQRVLLRVYLKC